MTAGSFVLCNSFILGLIHARSRNSCIVQARGVRVTTMTSEHKRLSTITQNRPWNRLIAHCLFLITLGSGISAQTVLNFDQNISVLSETNASIYRGIHYLHSTQETTGGWSDSPEITARCLSSLLSIDSVGTGKLEETIQCARGYLTEFLESNRTYSDSIVEDVSLLSSLSWALVSVSLPGSHDFNMFPGISRTVLESFRKLMVEKDTFNFSLVSGDNIDLYNFHQLLQNVIRIDHGLSRAASARPDLQRDDSILRKRSDKERSRFNYAFALRAADMGWFSGGAVELERKSSKIASTDCKFSLPILYKLSDILLLVYRTGGIGDIAMRHGLDLLTSPGLEIISSDHLCDGYYNTLNTLLKTDSLLWEFSAEESNIVGMERKIELLERILSRQLSNGNWVGVSGKFGEEDSNLCTALAISVMGMCGDQFR